MDISALKDWLVPISTFIALVTASIGGWLALREYRLKVKAETRLTRSAELEADIKLLKLFTEIMSIAHARVTTYVSEKAIETMLTPEHAKELGLSGKKVSDILESAVINLPVGVAAQDAAISAIWVLGHRHEILKPVAIQALTTLTGFKEKVATPYLEELKLSYKEKLLATSGYNK